MAMRSCRSTLEGIDAVIDREVGAVELLRFRFHLMMCSHCTRYYRQYVAVREAVGQVTLADLPEDFEEVMAPLIKRIGAATDDDAGGPVDT